MSRSAAGGMAVVYRAYDDAAGAHRVAIKVLAPSWPADEAFRQRFIRESRTAAAVDHPNIIPIFEAGEADGVLFIAMRFVHGPRRAGRCVETGGAAARRPGLRTSSPRSRPPWRRLIFHTAWCTGTSSRATSCSARGGRGPATPATRICSDFGLSKRALSVSALTIDRPVPGHAGLHRARADRGAGGGRADRRVRAGVLRRTPCSPAGRHFCQGRVGRGHVGPDLRSAARADQPPSRPARGRG